ncbi:MAG TPA: aldo/keto reductase, partial [bacterium]|nr:aldo/keto reductase [bacterium]
MSSRKGIHRRDLLKLGAAAGTLGFVGAPMRARAEGEAAAEDVLPQVPRRTLGKTGETIPILLVGGGVKLDQRFDPKLAEAYRFGANYIDAADCYNGGTCETAVAAFHTRAENRDNLWITSKSDQHDPKGFEETVHTSLEKMQTDYVNLYFLHALKDGGYLNDDLKVTVDRLKKEGKIRHFGFSCHNDNVAELLHQAARTPWVDAVMFRYNFRQYGDKELNDAMDACVKANVGLIAMKTQGSEASFQDAWQKFEQTGKWNKHQAVLKAVWADDRISAAVSHMDTFEKLKENIAAALDKTELGAADWESLEKYAAATRAHACDGCDHLCNAAVDAPVQIGATMRYLMYHDMYGDQDGARELFAKLPAGAKNLSGVDFARANAACPHGVDVAAHMKRA